MFQEKNEEKLERSCNFKIEIATLKETIQNKENELGELGSKLHTVTNAEETQRNYQYTKN